MNKFELTDYPKSYLPNVLIAILGKLCITSFNNYISIEVKQDDLKQDLKTELEEFFTLNGKCLIDFTEEDNTIILNLKQNDYVLVKHLYLGDERVVCDDFIKDYVKEYVKELMRDELIDENVNKDSWRTISERFLKSIDTTKNAHDYKIFSLEYSPVIVAYSLNKFINISKIFLRYTSNNVMNIWDDAGWEVKFVLSLNPLIRKIKGNNGEYTENYTPKEQKVLNLVEHYVSNGESYITPEEILDVLYGEKRINYKERRKYLSNFISRLNKKVVANTGHRLFEWKCFNDVYKINID